MPEQTTDKPVQLPMVEEIDEAALAKEAAYLAEVSEKNLGARLGAYAKLTGPGWLQGAMTLGGGSAASSLLVGTLAGYDLLWVQPLALVTGIIMLMAIGRLSLSTRLPPFEAVSRYAHPALAWAWALASLVASMIWCLPQFSLTESVFRDFATQMGMDVSSPLRSGVFSTSVSLAVLFVTLSITLNYGKNQRWIRRYEWVLKLMVAMIVVSFLIVVIKVDVDWGRVWRGFFGFHLPRDSVAVGVVITAFANAVGINMTFLFPYTLIAKGWGKEHRGLAVFDLWTGLFVPFVFATSLISIASAATLHGTFDLSGDMKPQAVDLAIALEPLAGEKASHFVFGLGILGMTVSTITLLMLVCGFIVSELAGGRSRKPFVVGAFLPAVGVLGPVVWTRYGFWMAVPVSNVTYFLMPIAYLTFMILMNRRAFLREEMPSGIKRVAWNAAMGMVLLIVAFGGCYKFHFGPGGAKSWALSEWSVWSGAYAIVMIVVFLGGIYTILFPPEPRSK